MLMHSWVTHLGTTTVFILSNICRMHLNIKYVHSDMIQRGILQGLENTWFRKFTTGYGRWYWCLPATVLHIKRSVLIQMVRNVFNNQSSNYCICLQYSICFAICWLKVCYHTFNALVRVILCCFFSVSLRQAHFYMRFSFPCLSLPVTMAEDETSLWLLNNMFYWKQPLRQIQICRRFMSHNLLLYTDMNSVHVRFWHENFQTTIPLQWMPSLSNML